MAAQKMGRLPVSRQGRDAADGQGIQASPDGDGDGLRKL